MAVIDPIIAAKAAEALAKARATRAALIANPTALVEFNQRKQEQINAARKGSDGFETAMDNIAKAIHWSNWKTTSPNN